MRVIHDIGRRHNDAVLPPYGVERHQRRRHANLITDIYAVEIQIARAFIFIVRSRAILYRD